jgi:hypothetical protein
LIWIKVSICVWRLVKSNPQKPEMDSRRPPGRAGSPHLLHDDLFFGGFLRSLGR